MSSSDVFWIFVLSVISVAVFLRPWLGIVLLILAGALGKFALFPLFNLDLVEVAAALTVWSGAIFLLFSRKRIELSPLDIPVALLALAVLFSVLNAPEGWLVVSGTKFLALLAVYFICVQLLNTASRVRATLVAFTIISGALAALCIAFYLLNIPTISIGGVQARLYYGAGEGLRIFGFFDQPNIWAQITSIAVPGGLALALDTKGWSRWLLGGLTGFSALCTLMTQSRSATVGMAVGVGCVLFFMRRRLRSPLAAALLLVVVASFVVMIQGSVRQWGRFTQHPVEQEFRTERRKSRAQVFVASVKVFLDHPLGVGFGADDRTVGGELGIAAGMSPHNTLLRWAINAGLIGLIAGIWLMVSQIRNLWRMARDQMASESGRLAAGVLGAVVATWIHNMFHAFLNLSYVWIFFSVASAMVLLRSRSPVAAPHAATRPHPHYARIVLPT
ncbi:MAG: O-antigen ligase family protein [Terriglobales bacterium]